MLADAVFAPVEQWTASRALKRLPATSNPKVEVLRGALIVSPAGRADHRVVECQLFDPLKSAGRQAGFWTYGAINIIDGDDLFIPDLSVLRRSGAGRMAMNIADAVLLVEIEMRKDVIDRPRVYAAAKVPWFMRIEFRRRVPSIDPAELLDD
jgi:hypothetical protein